jgi:hypothetical protein
MKTLSPVNAYNTAKDFLAAADRELKHSPPPSVSLTAYFLVSRAIEVGLKSFLILEGATDSDLRRIGHDLAKAVDEAVQAGIADVVILPPEGEAAVRTINAYYSAKDLEYVTTGFKSYPPLGQLTHYADTLLNGLQMRIRAWRPAT